jgi:membrane protein DedA with SNARE-associated domain
MLHHYIDLALTYAQSGSVALTDYLYLIVFIAALCESTPILGTLTPGTLFLLFFGYAAYVNGINIAVLILIGSIGAVVGDVIGYMLGKYAGGWMVRNKKILKEVHIEQGRGFFSRHGGKSIMIGRFVGPIRPIVPLIAGSIHMRFSKFLFWNILGAFIWASLYMLLGYFFGQYARKIEHITSGLSLILTVALIVVAYIVYKRYKKRHAEL